MILIFTFVFLIKSNKQCEIDDYFCFYLNKIEDRWHNPQNNLTDTISNEIQNLTQEVEKFSIFNDTQSNINIIFIDDENNIDLNSKLISSYLLRKQGQYDNDNVKITLIHNLMKVIAKKQPRLSHDFLNGYKINGHKGTFYYMLDREVSLHKIVISNVEDLNCSVKQYAILIGNQTFNAKPLLKGINGIQEYIFPKDQFCGGFKIQVLDNYGDNFTCFNEISAYRTM